MARHFDNMGMPPTNVKGGGYHDPLSDDDGDPNSASAALR